MRLDKYISSTGEASRREVAVAAGRGEVTVNGAPVRDPACHIDPASDTVTYRGKVLFYEQTVWIMLYKPSGYVSATEDSRLPVVTDLLPETLQKRGLFPVGRLDRDTTGLMLLTDEGSLAHRLLSPRYHVEKEYYFTCSLPLPCDAEARMAAGMTLGQERCKSAVLRPDADRLGAHIILTEGKYHQIKRMVSALGIEVTFLRRLSFGGVSLDPSLSPGEYRRLTDEEYACLCSHAEKGTSSEKPQ